MKDTRENIEKAKELLTRYCQKEGFQYNSESSTPKVKFWSKYLSKNMLFSIGIGEGGYSMNLIVVGAKQQVFKNSQTLPWFAFDLDYPGMSLWAMMHDVITPVFDEMLNLGIKKEAAQ